VLSPSTVKGYYLPLSMTSLMLDYAMGGRPDDLRVFHGTSLALHIINTLLMLLVLYRLFGALVPAGLVALLFGLHPLTVEPTAWIGERKTLLATCFALACVWCYVQHVRARDRGWFGASVALYLLALLSKPTVIMLPLLLLLLDHWPSSGSGAARWSRSGPSICCRWSRVASRSSPTSARQGSPPQTPRPGRCAPAICWGSISRRSSGLTICRASTRNPCRSRSPIRRCRSA